MDHLFIARHGHYFGQDLNQMGIKDTEKLGDSIARILNGGSISLVSSPSPRAVQSAEIIARKLGLPVPVDQDMLLEYGFKEKSMEIVQARREGVDSLILMAHLETAEDFPDYFFQQEFGRGIGRTKVSTGQAVYIDVNNQRYRIIP